MDHTDIVARFLKHIARQINNDNKIYNFEMQKKAINRIQFIQINPKSTKINQNSI
jgi:hypothetical protein